MHFVSIISEPTRFPSLGGSLPATTPSLLDHIWINFDWPSDGGIIYSDIPDHSFIFLIVEQRKNTVRLSMWRGHGDVRGMIAWRHLMLL